jgi:hypothetical protein
MPTTFNTTDPKPGYVYDAATDTWFPLLGIAPATEVNRWTKTAAGAETSLSGNDDNAVSLSYTAGTEQVYLNGVLLVRGQDYTATNGTTITGLTALAASDVAEVVTFNPSNIITTDAVIATDFEAKGDLISASAASTPIRLPVGTTGQVLKANSATTSGLEWATSAADIEGVTASTGLTGGGTSGTVTLSVDTAVVATTSNTLTMSGKTLSGATLTGTLTAGGGTGTNGQVLQSTGSGVQWGSAGLTFTDRVQSTASFVSIEYNGSNLYVAAGSGGQLFTSPDGITWTSRTSGFGSNSINKVAYGNGLWVAVGTQGTITTSSDGITWTARTANMSTNQLRDVKYANSVWVVVGAGGGTTDTGGITYSSDGITWTRKSQSITVGTSYLTVVYNGTNWIVGTTNSTNNYLYASTPSGTWTAAQTGTSNNVSQLFWDGTRNLALSNSNGQLNWSTSPTLGTTTQTDARISDGSYYYNSELYTGGAIVQVYSTVINANNTAIKNKVFLSPSAEIDTAGNISVNFNCIFAGAVGIMVSGNGHIYTSF